MLSTRGGDARWGRQTAERQQRNGAFDRRRASWPIGRELIYAIDL